MQRAKEIENLHFAYYALTDAPLWSQNGDSGYHVKTESDKVNKTRVTKQRSGGSLEMRSSRSHIRNLVIQHPRNETKIPLTT